ncbi:MAG TPA: low molecular weight protein-tyrosine-phosphatase [Acidimicrobiales bacterium]
MTNGDPTADPAPALTTSTSTSAPLRICFVCWGNICRSPAAEAIMRRLVDEAGLSDRIAVDSAGTSGEHLGEPPDRRTIKEARRRGLDVEHHRVWRFDTGDFARFDLVAVVDRANEQRLHQRADTDVAAAKVKLLRSYVADDPYDGEIPDPWYGGTEDFVLAFDLIEEACVALLEQLRCDLSS